MQKILLIALVLWISFNTVFASNLPHRLKLPLPSKKSLIYGLHTEYYMTDINFSQDNQTVEKADGAFSYILLSTGLVWSYKPQHQFTTDLDFIRTQSVDSSFTRNNINFSDLHFGYRYFTSPWGLLLVPEINFTYPFYKIETNSDDSLLGEGAMTFEPSIWISKAIKRLRLNVRTSYEWRSDGRSPLLHFTLNSSYRFKNNFILTGGIHGFDSITGDKYTDSPNERLTLVENVNAGSYRFYSINPQAFALYVAANVPVSASHSFDLGYSTEINGQAYAAGDSITFKWIYSPNNAQTNEQTSPTESKFQLDLEEVNETDTSQ